MKKYAKVFIKTAMVFLLLAGVFAPHAGAYDVQCSPPYTQKITSKYGTSQTDAAMCCPPGSKNETDCIIKKYINPTIRVLSIIGGIAVVIGIIMGALEYASSAGDPQKVAKGKGKIVSSLVALVVFMGLFGIIQFFSPGGVSSTRTGATAAACSKTFLGIKPWFAYLPDEVFDTRANDCTITNLQLFGSDGGGKGSHIIPVTVAVADALVRIAGLVAVVFVIVGGVKYITSQGEPEATKNAKNTIINALIGVVVAIIAAGVVSFVGNRLS